MDITVEQQREHFNEISERYIQARRHPNYLTLKNLIWKHFLARHAALKNEVDRVLEPMCGMAEGYETVHEYLNRTFDYVGFDYSENMVALARRRQPSLSIEWNDVTTYRSAGALFDLVILSGGLHHVHSRAQDVLVNLGRSIRPGGFFLSLEPTHNNWFSRRVRRRVYRTNCIFDADTEQGFEYHTLDGHFRNAGYEKIDEVYPGLLAYVLYFNPDAFPALNVGGTLLVRGLFAVDRLFWDSRPGRYLSFATLSLWRRK